jgi:signal transduction histidine kinase
MSPFYFNDILFIRYLAFIWAIFSFAISIFVYLRNRKSILNCLWAGVSLGVGFWCLGAYFLLTSKDYTNALFAARFLHFFAIPIPVLQLHFTYFLLSVPKNQQRFLRSSYLVTIVLLLSDFTPLFIKGVATKPYFRYYAIAGLFYHIFTILYFGLSIYWSYLLIKAIPNLTSWKRNQVKYVTIASIIGISGGASTFPLIYNIAIPPFSALLVALYPLIIAYAIIRHRLMDITIAITRTGIFVAVYTLVLGLPFTLAFWFKTRLISIFGVHWWISPLVLMAISATVGPFIYIYLQRKAEERLLKEQRQYQDTLKQASVGMTRIRNLKKLLDLIAHIVTKTVKISYAGIYLFNRDNNEYTLEVSRDKGRSPVSRLTPDNPLVSYLTQTHQPLIYEEIKRKVEDNSNPTYKLLEQNMQLLTATLIIPSFLENRLLAFIVLGEKLSGEIYTFEDINVFQVLASQSALAIENAHFFEEAKEMQEQIAQAEKMATIGTMADGLSHQINNRFNALSLIAGDTIDTIKMTDASKCSPEIKEMLSQISRALERIQANVIQGGEVVSGLLKYTRKDSIGFEALDLNTILNNTLEMVQFKVRLSEIDIVRNFSHNLPRIKGNLAQLEEVFFNFIDNAYDAITERRDLLKEPNYRGRITIIAKPKTDSLLEITVEDNGIGVKDENAERLFTPFFTTKASSRKGTGLGLYVIRRIITDAHKGEINFESKYKVGTRFIVELPQWQDY